MAPTRRALTGTLLGASALSLAPALLRAGPASAQALPPPVPVVARPGLLGPALSGMQPRALLQRARLGPPAMPSRAALAIDRTLDRLDEFGLEGLPGRVLVVNIAGAEVIAYQDGREVLRSRAIVGASKTRTPQLATTVTTVRTNPPWYVPASIVPEIRAKGMTGFVTQNGRLVQPPGPRNPLGPIRIGLEDSDGIFLHGTSAPELFARSDRALSHGCVRVERVFDVAAWVLDMTPAALRALVASGRTTENLPVQEVQVALAYLTAWPAANGRPVFYPDPYGYDAPGSRRAAFRRAMRPLPQPDPAAPAVPPMEGDTVAHLAEPGDDPM